MTNLEMEEALAEELAALHCDELVFADGYTMPESEDAIIEAWSED